MPDLSLTPAVVCGKPTLSCMGGPRVFPSRRTSDGAYRLTAVQSLSVQVPLELNVVFTRSPGYFQENLCPTVFSDEALCRAVQGVSAASSFLAELLAGHGDIVPGGPCPPIFPLSCQSRLAELLTPAAVQEVLEARSQWAPVLGQLTRQLLTLLLNQSLPVSAATGLRPDHLIDLTRFPAAAALLGERSTVAELGRAADKALLANDLAQAEALQPALAALNAEGIPPVLSA